FAGAGLVDLDPIAVAFGVFEVERVDRRHTLEQLVLGVCVEQQGDAFARAQAEVPATARAYPLIGFEIAGVDRLATGLALRPQSFGDCGSCDLANGLWLFGFFEPGHGASGELDR